MLSVCTLHVVEHRDNYVWGLHAPHLHGLVGVIQIRSLLLLSLKIPPTRGPSFDRIAIHGADSAGGRSQRLEVDTGDFPTIHLVGDLEEHFDQST
jgi:hypothetical protein